MLFPVREIAQELARGVVLESLKGSADLGIEISGCADVVLEGVEVPCCKCCNGEEMVRFEDDLVLVIVSVGENREGDTGERVGLGVSCAQFMCEQKVKPAEVERPASLVVSEVLCCMPILEVAMVRDNVKWLRETFEIMPPIFKGANDGKHFSVVDLIVMFRLCHRLGTISYRMPVAGGVNFKACGMMGFPHGKDRFIGEFVFEALEG